MDKPTEVDNICDIIGLSLCNLFEIAKHVLLLTDRLHRSIVQEVL